MSFSKDKIAEELRKQVEALDPAMKKLKFVRNEGHYWDSWYHSRSMVRVQPVPVKENGSWGFYSGFKLKVNRNEHPGRGSHTVLVKIDNLEAVKGAVKDSLLYIRARDKSTRLSESFKGTLEKTAPRMFPDREAKIYSASGGSFQVSVARKNHVGAWFSVTVSTSGVVEKVEISYPGKSLEDVAKLLMEKW